VNQKTVYRANAGFRWNGSVIGQAEVPRLNIVVSHPCTVVLIVSVTVSKYRFYELFPGAKVVAQNPVKE
jgi:hypothetical protein